MYFCIHLWTNEDKITNIPISLSYPFWHCVICQAVVILPNYIHQSFLTIHQLCAHCIQLWCPCFLSSNCFTQLLTLLAPLQAPSHARVTAAPEMCSFLTNSVTACWQSNLSLTVILSQWTVGIGVMQMICTYIGKYRCHYWACSMCSPYLAQICVIQLVQLTW